MSPMRILKTNRRWLESLVWSAVISIPFCLFMFLDSTGTPDESVLPPQLYALGVVAYYLFSFLKGYDDGQYYVMIGMACFANAAVIWLIVHVVLYVWRKQRSRNN